MNKLFNLVGFVLCTISMAFAGEVTAPEINVGSNWTYKKVDAYSGAVVSKWKNVVLEKANDGYGVSRLDASGVVTRKYVISKNLGIVSPTPSGKSGDGNLYMFPLKTGIPPWTTRTYWKNSRGEEGYDEVTYAVQGEQELKIAGAAYSVVKLTGSGRWVNSAQNGSGALSVVSYYAPDVMATVRAEWTTSYGQTAPTREVFELTEFELK